ncbi:MAG: monovalent cation/H(+) antiporter subunit G [Verrucomicrobiota bacterium]|nr:monovalent cation/H(+) antiporter subunit G [Verrucomicrobiota bacterium]
MSIMDNILNVLSIILIFTGLIFFMGASVGLIRFPDFYTRMHAAGKGDTLSTILITTGMAAQVLSHFDWVSLFVAIKIVAIAVLIMLTSPTSTHLLMKAGYDDGIEPFTNSDKDGIIELGGPFLRSGRSDGIDPKGKNEP